MVRVAIKMELKPVKCECGKEFDPRLIIAHTYRCAAFHKSFGAEIIGARYSK